MILKNHEIVISRNESITLDFEIVNQDNTPYRLSYESVNPYLLITFSSAYYGSELDTVRRYWINLDYMAKFENMQLMTKSDFLEIMDSIDFDELSEGKYYALLEDNGKYVYYNHLSDSDTVGDFVDYSFNQIIAFTTEETSKWLEQNYLYCIEIVEGDSVEKLINELWTVNIFDMPEVINYKERYRILLERGISMPKTLDIDKPLYNITNLRTILPPTKFSVRSDLKGGII